MRGALPMTLLAAVLAIATPALAVWGMPEGVNERMEIINGIYGQIMLVGVIVFLFVMAWMAVAIWRFRPGGAGQKTDEKHRGSLKAELVWTIIPFLIVAWIGVISYGGLFDLRAQPEPGQAEEIKVTGFQWFWEAEYPNGLTVSAKPGPEGGLDNTEPFLIPANEDILFNITSADVIHSLWIPDLGVKMDATPGTNTYATAEAPEGTYFTQCAEYCGVAHAYMRAQFKAVSEAEYEAWLDEKLAEQRSGGNLITVTDTGVEPNRIQAVAGASFEYLVLNSGSSPIEASFANASTGQIQPDDTAWLNTTAPGAGTYELTVGERTIQVELIEPETVHVELGDFVIEPETSQFEPGEAYLLNVTNTHSTVHNLYIGTPQEEGGEDVILANSPDLEPGESAEILYIPEEGGGQTFWCDIPGHYQGGMVTSITVS